MTISDSKILQFIEKVINLTESGVFKWEKVAATSYGQLLGDAPISRHDSFICQPMSRNNILVAKTMSGDIRLLVCYDVTANFVNLNPLDDDTLQIQIERLYNFLQDYLPNLDSFLDDIIGMQ